MFSLFRKGQNTGSAQVQVEHEESNAQAKPQSESLLKRYEETMTAWRDKQKSEGRLRNAV